MADEASGSRAEAAAALRDRYERMRTQYTERIAVLEAQLEATDGFSSQVTSGQVTSPDDRDAYVNPQEITFMSSSLTRL